MTQPFDAARAYLFVSAAEPLAAAAAVWDWAEGLPDLCVTSPSRQAHDTAVFACAGHFVRVTEEPLLTARDNAESEVDFADRFAEALRIVLAFDARAALVVCDDLPAGWATPYSVEGTALLRRADLIDRELPLP